MTASKSYTPQALTKLHSYKFSLQECRECSLALSVADNPSRCFHSENCHSLLEIYHKSHKAAALASDPPHKSVSLACIRAPSAPKTRRESGRVDKPLMASLAAKPPAELTCARERSYTLSARATARTNKRTYLASSLHETFLPTELQ